MRRVRRSNWAAHAKGEGPPGGRALSSCERGFTLIELIIVMLLLAIAASLVAPRMSSFFRGRALNHEVRRMLSLAHYAQSRAVSEGVPVVLWVDPKSATYGVEVQGGREEEDEGRREYTAEPTLTFSVPSNATLATGSEQEDEGFGLPEGRAAIRFTPDGFIDEVSVQRILVQQNDGAALELALKSNRLGYEILPANHTAN